jgi:hypothetical protein
MTTKSLCWSQYIYPFLDRTYTASFPFRLSVQVKKYVHIDIVYYLHVIVLQLVFNSLTTRLYCRRLFPDDPKSLRRQVYQHQRLHKRGCGFIGVSVTLLTDSVETSILPARVPPAYVGGQVH